MNMKNMKKWEKAFPNLIEGKKSTHRLSGGNLHLKTLLPTLHKDKVVKIQMK